MTTKQNLKWLTFDFSVLFSIQFTTLNTKVTDKRWPANPQSSSRWRSNSPANPSDKCKTFSILSLDVTERSIPQGLLLGLHRQHGRRKVRQHRDDGPSQPDETSLFYDPRNGIPTAHRPKEARSTRVLISFLWWWPIDIDPRFSPDDLHWHARSLRRICRIGYSHLPPRRMQEVRFPRPFFIFYFGMHVASPGDVICRKRSKEARREWEVTVKTCKLAYLSESEPSEIKCLLQPLIWLVFVDKSELQPISEEAPRTSNR